MALYWNVPGFSHHGTDERHGDSQFFVSDDGGKRYILVIDGYEGEGVANLRNNLKLFKATDSNTTCRFVITHWHYDHYYGVRQCIKSGAYKIDVLYCQDPASLKSGLRDNKGSDYVRAAINTANTIISEAKARGIKVIFLKNKQKVSWHGIKFQAFRDLPSRVENSDRNGDSYLNDGSLATWFPDIKYLTSGDGPARLDIICKTYGLDPIFIKGPHHGNCLIRVCAMWLKSHGCWLYWDNDLSDHITDFLQTGREDAKAVGMTVLDCVGDINGYTFGGYFYVIHKGKKVAKYIIPDKTSVTAKTATASLVRNILRGNYGAGDKRVTKLLSMGYSPLSAQNKVNLVVQIAKDIKNGDTSYGKGDDRIKKIDGELGKGFGQLTQDYINVLFGVRDKV